MRYKRNSFAFWLLTAQYCSSHNCKISKVSIRTAIEFQPGADWKGTGCNQPRATYVCALFRVWLKQRAPFPFQSPAVRSNRRIGRDTGHYSNRPPNFGRATPRIALGGAAIIEGAVGPCHVLKPVITHAFTARIIPFWQVASHSM